ncbi:uncharacterized protein TNIN_159491 [Trichonephila inaurata madagascariensis]|uniref:Gustatory receptor n=1 Tax=Trichonephila inaurata madagascariensis TaxID=2747483 RepID=A0A8X6I3S7_9ARAC|nr:uncharacterized protein TNIN_159491 [Trichonephila inaurata madagascariensis]
MPVFTCLFAHVCLLIEENSLMIKQSLHLLQKQKSFHVSQIRRQRRMFCHLQKQTSEANAIFTEICFLWISKSVLRCYFDAYDLLNEPWNENNWMYKCLILLDAVFHISSLLIVSFYGGRVSEVKTKILDSLIRLGMVSHSRMEEENYIEDINYFINIVGNSDMSITLWNIMPLKRSIAVSLLSVIGSYSVIIFQLSNRE